VKITKSYLKQIIKEEISNLSPPSGQPVSQENEPRQNIRDLIKKIIGDGGDDTSIEQLQKIFGPIPDAKKAEVIDAISKAVLGVDLGDKHLKQAVKTPDK
tara:strand:- start:443 stop:742 length:300 start_codon:yes stop_codon:yes gene_type:complete